MKMPKIRTESLLQRRRKNIICDFNANGFGLPTEAESDNPDEVAWYATDQAHPVGLKKPNELGLYDM